MSTEAPTSRIRIDRNDEDRPRVAPDEVAWVEVAAPVDPSGEQPGFLLDRQSLFVGFSCSHVNVRTGVYGMSRRHLLLERRDGKWWASDGGSTNGSRHNGERLDRAPRALADGDRLELGPSHVFVFRSAPPPGPTR